MKSLKVIVPAAIVGAGLLVCTTASYGTQAFAKKEDKKCAYCHTAPGKKDLNDTGKCYKTNEHSLAKCAAPPEKK